jgi:hypothetical protein
VKGLHGVPHFLVLLPLLLFSHFYVPLRFAHSNKDVDQFAKKGAMFLLSLPGVVRPPLGRLDCPLTGKPPNFAALLFLQIFLPLPAAHPVERELSLFCWA